MNAPLFSVIIPTRNRSAIFETALQSVLEQRFRQFEVIVVNDGSSEEDLQRYGALVGVEPLSTRMLTLAHLQHGHGPSYVRNYGASQARGDFLCFLDDDDQWVDSEHLGRAANVINESKEPVDLLLADTRAFRNGVPIISVIWIEDLKARLNGEPDRAGAYTVTAKELLRCPAHCHINSTIVSRPFFLDIGGFDDGLRYEEDRDFYLRAIDSARLIKYMPSIVSRHNVPDPAIRTNTSTSEAELSKRLFQLRVFDKATLFAARREVRRYAMRQRAYTLKHIAMEAARIGRLDCAMQYARESLVTNFTFAWLGATLLFSVRHLQSRFQRSSKIDRAA
jgi:glycosyltransferase involved in cell wall biosynthesis